MRLSKIMKIIVSIMLVAMLMIFASQNVFADESTPATTGGGTTSTASKKDLKSTFSKRDNSGASRIAGRIISMIINIAQIIGIGFSIIMLVVLGIQYVGASPNGKAEIKKNSQLYILGAIIIFAASGILGIIRRFAVKSIAVQGS